MNSYYLEKLGLLDLWKNLNKQIQMLLNKKYPLSINDARSIALGNLTNNAKLRMDCFNELKETLICRLLNYSNENSNFEKIKQELENIAEGIVYEKDGYEFLKEAIEISKECINKNDIITVEREILKKVLA